MKRLATFTAQGRQLWGAVADTGLVALSDSFLDWRTLRSVIAADVWKIVSNAAKNLAVTHPFGSFQWDIPVPDPEKIICVGVNFPDRNAEDKEGQDAPPNMSLFPRFPRSFAGHEQPLTRPRERATGLRRRNSRGHRQGWSPHPRGTGIRPDRRPDALQRRHHPRLGSPREIQRDPRQELGRLRRHGPLAGAFHQPGPGHRHRPGNPRERRDQAVRPHRPHALPGRPADRLYLHFHHAGPRRHHRHRYSHRRRRAVRSAKMAAARRLGRGQRDRHRALRNGVRDE